jgi:aspartyl-tRNA(Asn)/glutamyl-tRNA(Gln) amidotransferase subunit B
VVNEKKIELDDYRVRPETLARLIGLVSSGAIGGKAAKEVFDEMSETGESPDPIVERKGLAQVSDPAAIREAAEKVLAANAAQVQQYRSGKSTVFGFLVGQLMKETRGRAKADLANQVLRELLDDPVAK